MENISRDTSIIFFKGLIGEENFNKIPTLSEDLLKRFPNCGRYTMFLQDDIDYKNNCGLLKANDCYFLVLRDSQGNLQSYKFTYNLFSTCRHGRPLYKGAYTEIIYHYKLLVENSLHNEYIFKGLFEFIKTLQSSL